MNNRCEGHHNMTVAEKGGHCNHLYQQIPRCNLAKCVKCGGVRYRKNYER